MTQKILSQALAVVVVEAAPKKHLPVSARPTATASPRTVTRPSCKMSKPASNTADNVAGGRPRSTLAQMKSHLSMTTLILPQFSPQV
jgi:hypothetical protein